jgi:hypothetical protein
VQPDLSLDFGKRKAKKNKSQPRRWGTRRPGALLRAKTEPDGVFEKQVVKRKRKEKGDKTEIKRNHPDATPQFASPNQLSEHGISFHQPMAPIKSLFGFRVARVVMSEQG